MAEAAVIVEWAVDCLIRVAVGEAGETAGAYAGDRVGLQCFGGADIGDCGCAGDGQSFCCC